MTKKPGFPQLAAMRFLVDGEGGYRFVSSHPTTDSMDWYVVEDGKGEDGRYPCRLVYSRYGFDGDGEAFADSLGGSAKVDFQPLIQAGHVAAGSALFSKSAEALYEKLSAGRVDARDVLYRASRKGREWWEAEGRAQYAEAAQARESERRKVARTVLIGETVAAELSLPAALARRWPSALPLPVKGKAVMRPAYTATVVKETAQRVYVMDVKAVNPGRPEMYSSVVQGRRPRQYVDREHVMADYVTAVDVERLVAIDREARQDYTDACVQAIEEILPVIERMDARHAQQEAMRQDMVREVKEEIEARKQGESPSATKPR